jgi:hypothetical protein
VQSRAAALGPKLCCVFALLALTLAAAAPTVPAWLQQPPTRNLEVAFPPPAGFVRVAVEPASFSAFLRTLPLAPPGTPVLAYDGASIRAGSDPHVAAVADLDVGKRNLQQCADSIIRLGGLSYPLTSGAPAAWSAWSAGMRPHVTGQRVQWSHDAVADTSYGAFRRYLDFVFTYAGTRSLSSYATKVERAALQPGDFLVDPARKDAGHAVLILDVATDQAGHRLALLGQGFMPAQSFHVLADGSGSAWFSLDGDTVATPYWTPFPWSSLRRLP